jgi:hypothetical protein
VARSRPRVPQSGWPAYGPQQPLLSGVQAATQESRALRSGLHLPQPAPHVRHSSLQTAPASEDRPVTPGSRVHYPDDGHILAPTRGHRRRCFRGSGRGFRLGRFLAAALLQPSLLSSKKSSILAASLRLRRWSNLRVPYERGERPSQEFDDSRPNNFRYQHNSNLRICLTSHRQGR